MQELNKEQKEAVETTEGALLVLSGAGTGKTKVITSRLAYIIQNGFARPWECLAVTFTNKAASEMKERLAATVGTAQAQDVWLGTFHSIGLKLLRRFAQNIGYESNFSILGEDDQRKIVKQLMEAEGMDIKKTTPDAVLNVIQGWKDKGFMPDEVLDTKSDFTGGKILSLYHIYQNRLHSMNAVDFGDLLLLCLNLFKSYPDILQKYQNQFRYIMVDEYQDTNAVQYMWLRLLAKGHNNLCCVGDDDQSIYSWRGAEINNILSFDKDFKDAKIIRLVQNYRSGSHILSAASALIGNNRGRLGKELIVAEGREDDAEKIKICGLWDWRQEADKAVNIIEDAHRRGTAYKDMAVLVRTGVQTREFEEAFISNAIPYQVIGGKKFYEREEIRDAVAYLRLCVIPSDDMALERIINKPRRGIGDTTVSVIRSLAMTQEISMFAAAEKLSDDDNSELKKAAKNSVAAFVDSVYKWQDILKDNPAELALERILEESGYIDMWKTSKLPEAEGKLDNIAELLGVIKEGFDTVQEFLEHVALVADTDDLSPLDKVNVMTLHSAKGLEFDTVILPGWEEGLFPHQRSLDESGEKGLEEERRLAYVGLTRAKHHLWITFAGSRRIYNEWQNNPPSRFLAEIPAKDADGNVPKVKTAPDFNDMNIMWHRSSLREELREERRERMERRRTQPVSFTSKSGFYKGQQVRHNIFGAGIVYKVEGDKLEVVFENVGRKTILASFVKAV